MISVTYHNSEIGIVIWIIPIIILGSQVSFATSPLKVNGRKVKGTSVGRKPFETLTDIGLQVQLPPLIGILRPTPVHVAEVISGHERSPAVFRQ